jgi:hypothetical protein
MVGKESSNKYLEFIKQKKDKLLIGLIFVLGIILRILFINTREIAYDDAFSYFLARNDLKTIISGTLADTMPPLYYFLLHIWMKISTDLWFLRLLNITINLVTAILVYQMTRQFLSQRTAIISLLLFIISPFQIYHSQELRMYSLLLLSQVGFFYAIFKTIDLKEPKQKIWMIIAVFFGTVSMYSHNLGFVGLLSVNIILLFKREKAIFVKLIFAQLAILVLSLPWLYYLPQQIHKVQQAFWTVAPGLIDIIQSMLTLFAFLPMPIFLMGFILLIILQSIILVLLYLYKQKDRKHWILFLLLIFPPIILFVLSYLVQPVFVPRIFIISSIWFFILFSEYISDFWEKKVGKINLSLFILISIISLPFFYRFNEFPRSPFKELSEFIRTEINDKTPIIHDNKLSFFPVMFHSEKVNQFYLKDIEGSPNDTLAIGSQTALGYFGSESINKFLDEESIMFVVFQKSIDEYQSIGEKHPVLQILEDNYGSETNKILIGDLIIYSFGEKE